MNVTIEVYGLAEAAASVKEAAETAHAVLGEVQEAGISLNPEQLDRVIDLTAAMNENLVNLNRLLANIGPAIEQARQPARGLFGDVLEEFLGQTFDPVLKVADSVLTVGDSMLEYATRLFWTIVCLAAVQFLLAIAMFKRG